jgi:glucose/arabinose dehydrogenase
MRHLIVLGLLATLACGDDDDPAMDGSVPTDGGRRDAEADAGDDRDAGEPEDAGVDAGPQPCTTTALPSLTTEEVVGGLSAPVFATTAPGAADTLFVVEKTGTIAVVRDGARVGTFLDLRAGLLTDGEQGLLGLAFHPDYATNRRFFVFFTPGGPRRNVVAEFRRSEDDPDAADPTEVARLVEENDSESNHNGGMLAFGPDGYLYVAMGDEGGGDDRHGEIGNGLDTSTLFGKILRLDVDADEADYAAAGNPFSGAAGLPQIFHYGVRNPWRFSFDRATGDLWIADVGQGRFEEINLLPAGTPGGRNLGWAEFEGFEPTPGRPDLEGLVTDHYEPLIAYGRGEEPVGGNSISGGYVYRGAAIPTLRGWYLYGDFGSPHVGAVRVCDGEVRDHLRATGLSSRGSGLVSFGEDADGELLIVYIGSGNVVRVVAAD